MRRKSPLERAEEKNKRDIQKLSLRALTDITILQNGYDKLLEFQSSVDRLDEDQIKQLPRELQQAIESLKKVGYKRGI